MSCTSIRSLIAGLATAVFLTVGPGPSYSQGIAEAVQDLAYFLGTPQVSQAQRVPAGKEIIVGLDSAPGALSTTRDIFQAHEKICITLALENPGRGNHDFAAYWTSHDQIKESFRNIFTDNKPEMVWSCLTPPRPKWATRTPWKVQAVLDGNVVAERMFWVEGEVK